MFAGRDGRKPSCLVAKRRPTALRRSYRSSLNGEDTDSKEVLAWGTARPRRGPATVNQYLHSFDLIDEQIYLVSREETKQALTGSQLSN